MQEENVVQGLMMQEALGKHRWLLVPFHSCLAGETDPPVITVPQSSLTSTQSFLPWHGFKCSPNPVGTLWKEPQLIYVPEWNVSPR